MREFFYKYNLFQWQPAIVFVCVNLAVIICVFMLLLMPIFDFFNKRGDRISEQLNILARYESVAAQETQVQAYSKKIADNNINGELIPGASEGIANANLQDRLKSLAEQSHMTVVSIQMLPKKNVGVISMIGARIEVSGNYENTYQFCRILEETSPTLLISAADIIITPVFQQQLNSTRQINTRLDIYAGAISRTGQ
jgi:Tfp pilus assembly protein PilO